MLDRRTAEQILHCAVGLSGSAMWEAIDKKIDSMLLNENTLQTATLIHLACFSSDGRHLMRAIEYCEKSENWVMLANILQIARKYGEVKAVLAIHKIGVKHDLPELIVEDLPNWFQTHGIYWFDLYEDRQAGICFITSGDYLHILNLINDLYENPEAFWQNVLDPKNCPPQYPEERYQLLKALASDQEPITETPANKRSFVDVDFRAFATKNNIQIPRQLQEGIEDLRRCSSVFLGVDTDGIVKIWKEALTHEQSRFNSELDSETSIFEEIGDSPHFPKYYGTDELAPGVMFLRREFIFGQSLNDYTRPETVLAKDEAISIIRQLAEQLHHLHEHDIAYLDLRPDNVLLKDSQAHLSDFNTSRKMNGRDTVTAFILDPRFAAPEVVLECKAGKQTDIFQLGLLFHQLLTGRLPFVMAPELTSGKRTREHEVLKFALGNATLPYRYNLTDEFDDKSLKIISRMLAKTPSDRPTAKEIVEHLTTRKADVQQHRRAADVKPERNTVLFPARMGIPHKGHIEYISRIIDLGYHVRISLQRSYTITDRDPIPKWQVMKMVARSLLDLGFAPSSFSFILTPFFETDEEHQMHFAMLPGREHIVAVASSNPAVRNLFPNHPFLEQKAVFGTEGKLYCDRSWGEILRTAVKQNDRKTFEKYTASGVEHVLPLKELQVTYAETPVEFVEGRVRILLQKSAEQIPIRLGRYQTPEEAIATYLGAKILDPYSKFTVLQIGGIKQLLRYKKATLTSTGDKILHFEL